MDKREKKQTMTKAKQLKVAFKVILKDMLSKAGALDTEDDRRLIIDTSTVLLKEVTIRTKIA